MVYDSNDSSMLINYCHPVALQLLRLKCEAYSTFNDSDDDSDAEKRWQAKVTNSTGFASHNAQYIAPAALYLTAILECVYFCPLLLAK